MELYNAPQVDDDYAVPPSYVPRHYDAEGGVYNVMAAFLPFFLLFCDIRSLAGDKVLTVKPHR